MSSNSYKRTDCRLCGSSSLLKVLHLEPCPPVDAFVTKENLNQFQASFPLDLSLCQSCGHFQLLDIVDPSLLFGDYIYTTSSSPLLQEHFREYAETVCQFQSFAISSKALDIGSNDGTLLRFLKGRGFQVLGVDPAKEIAKNATESGIETIPSFFSLQTARSIKKKFGHFDLITANNVFAHSDNLSDMANGIFELLSDNGLFVCEVSYILDMVQNMVFDFIYHEHLSHHSLRPLIPFFEKHGLKIVHVENNKSKGGTLRVYVRKNLPHFVSSASISAFLDKEDKFGLYHLETFSHFQNTIASRSAELHQILDGFKSRGKRIAAYGASATGTVLMYHFGLSGYIDFIVDDNPLRQGRFSPGHHIPVLSPDQLYLQDVNVLLILAWRFSEMIVHKHEKFKESGGTIVVPLPDLRII